MTATPRDALREAIENAADVGSDFAAKVITKALTELLCASDFNPVADELCSRLNTATDRVKTEHQEWLTKAEETNDHNLAWGYRRRAAAAWGRAAERLAD